MIIFFIIVTAIYRCDKMMFHQSQYLFGKIFVKHRRTLGYNQEEMARHLGCHRSLLGMVERGQRLPTDEMIQLLIKQSGKTIKALTIFTFG